MGVEMEKVKIGILWNDGEYAEALARALARFFDGCTGGRDSSDK